MADKVSLLSQIAAVSTVQRAIKPTPSEKRLLNKHLEAAEKTLRFVQSNEQAIRAYVAQRGRA